MKKPKPIPLGALGPRRARFTGPRRPDPFLGHSWSIGLLSPTLPGGTGASWVLWRCWRCHQWLPGWAMTEKIGVGYCQARHRALLPPAPKYLQLALKIPSSEADTPART